MKNLLLTIVLISASSIVTTYYTMLYRRIEAIEMIILTVSTGMFCVLGKVIAEDLKGKL